MKRKAPPQRAGLTAIKTLDRSTSEFRFAVVLIATTGETVDDPHENESVKLRMVNESRQVFGTQAAAQLWFRLGLPVVPAMLHDPRQLNLLDYSVVKSANGGAPA